MAKKEEFILEKECMKTINYATNVVKEIKEEVNEGVIKDCMIPTLCNIKTGETTGFAVVLTLSTKYDYTNTILDAWKERLCADEYLITSARNQLKVRFNVRY